MTGLQVDEVNTLHRKNPVPKKDRVLHFPPMKDHDEKVEGTCKASTTMKFNINIRKRSIARNHEGAKAYVITPQLELYTRVVTSTLENKFYEGAGENLKRIRELIAQNDPVFVAKLAVYAREKMHLRSIPLVLSVELANAARGNSLVSKTVGRTIQRADEITELLAYYELANGRTGTKRLNKLSKQVQKGLAEAFNRFDEYQFAKYDREGAIKLKDALFLVHPKAKSAEQQVLFDKIASDTLQVPYTWEVELSRLGQIGYESEVVKQTAFTAKWEELIAKDALGYMALLRNLRNILQANVSAASIRKVCAKLADPDQVKRSKQLPFRFLSAYRELGAAQSADAGRVLQALEDAVLQSAANIKGFDDNTTVLVACDVSGSMQMPVSAKSKVQLYDVGLMLGMLLQSRCERVITGMFGDIWKTISLPKRNVLANVMEFRKREGEVGYSTNGHLVVQDIIDRRKVVDKVMLFTDCQLWNSKGGSHINTLWAQYKRIAPNAKLYLFDLAGHGTTPLSMHGGDVFLIAGWSEKVFDVLNAIEAGGDAVAEIMKIEL
jgi:hypothetical protein